MYYRRKIILALLQQFGGKLKPTRFQKLLLIFTRQQQNPAYEFIPYKYGAYSMQARSDKGTMIKYEQLKDSDIWEINVDEDYISQLKITDQEILKELYSRFKAADYKDLVSYTYREYPFYAINSEIASKYLDATGLNSIELVRPQNKSQKLYTVGYEGIKAEAYMNKLVSKDVRLLVDVRKNSMSMKYGFNKSQLKSMCKKLGIEFIHLSELGIESDKRKNLDSKADYEELFEEYEKTLPERTEHLEELYSLFKEYKRVAITCFEKEHTSCHRHKVSDYLNSKYEVPIEHL
ncbi:DUF488 domain-containing protein [Fodinibius sp. SL11]|uniref:DUF488 domain-containing protein n=1 Tax=Fodinibius sp. SL11 TaxID=3425690 RepID=UPI003F880550